MIKIKKTSLKYVISTLKMILKSQKEKKKNAVSKSALRESEESSLKFLLFIDRCPSRDSFISDATREVESNDQRHYRKCPISADNFRDAVANATRGPLRVTSAW